MIRQIGRRFYSHSVRRQARILASDPIETVCSDVFKKRGHELVLKPGIKPDELESIIHEYEGLIVRSGTKVTKDIIEAGVNLKIIGRAGTGVDNIDLKAATNKGVLVVNTPGGNTLSTAELTMAHIMSLARNIPQASASLKAGRWDRSKFTGTELTGKILGVIGIGRIGREVAKMANAMGMQVIGFDPVMSDHAAKASGIETASFEELLAKSDFITVHTPLTHETRYLFNASNIAKCKPGVRLINCARGGIIDEMALLDNLNSGHVAGAALDTLEQEPPTDNTLELRQHPNLIMTPHLGASTHDAQVRVAKAIAENVCDIFDGGSYVGVVNAPDLGAIMRREEIAPFLQLAENLGSMHAQLLQGNKVKSLTVTLRGKDISDSKLMDVFKAAVVKGALGELGVSNPSYVNALALADELGLVVNISVTPEPSVDSGYTNTISVELEAEGMFNVSHNIQGTVFGRNEVRVTHIDGFSIELPPGDNMLLFNNIDKPGVLNGVVSTLAKEGVEVTYFSLGRKSVPGGKAMGAMVLNTSLAPEIMEKLKKLKDVHNFVQVSLPATSLPFLSNNSGSQYNVTGSTKPLTKPRSPEFSSGPCKKRPGYHLDNLRTDVLGRSHRSKLGKSRLKKAIEETKNILGIPSDYLCGIVPASDTGAFEMAMWNMLGPRPVDACHWESFGKGWREDAVKHLKVPEVRDFTADYGKIPELWKTDSNHDILFTFNGTTSGVRVPDLNWIRDDREGLTFNDATSAAFAMEMDWQKADVTTFSWQKALGGEGAHGMLVLSPRAVERLESFTPTVPLPKIFRMVKNVNGKRTVDAAIFNGDTINTPSMLCVEDYLDALQWSHSVGGLQGLIGRSQANLAVLERFVQEHSWINFLAADPSIRSNTSVCLTLDAPGPQVKKLVALLEAEGVAYDIGAYRDAPDGLRIWCGATVEEADVEALLPWLKWAYEVTSDSTTV